MSIIEDLGAQLRTTADELPLGLVAQALERLRFASDRLRWVRQESVDPLGVPELSAATEHVESAGHALWVAQEQLTAYLAAIGLGSDRTPVVQPGREPKHDTGPVGPVPPAPRAPTDDPGPVRRWWSLRVVELTGGRDGTAAEPGRRVSDAGELIRRVAANVRSGDRDRLHTDLRDVDANVGLGMAAVAPPVLRDLTTQLLGHPPRAADLPRLRAELSAPLRDLLPGLPPRVLDTLLTRVCRMPPPKTPEQSHPADPAVAAGVVTGLLLHRLGRDPKTAITPVEQESHG